MKRGETIAVVAATLIAIGTAMGVSLSGESVTDDPNEWHVATGALDGDCAHSGANPDGGVQFISTCPQSSTSIDGLWTLVQTPAVGPEESYDVFLQAKDGRRIGLMPDLNDGMPFVLYWSPRRDWFLINHWQGSGLQLPRLFEITPQGVVEHGRHLQTAAAKAREISPCLPAGHHWVTGDGLKWSKDGSRIAWIFRTRHDMCVFFANDGRPIPPDKRWKPFLMISDVESGVIVPGSVRLLGGENFTFPTDGPFANF